MLRQTGKEIGPYLPGHTLKVIYWSQVLCSGQLVYHVAWTCDVVDRICNSRSESRIWISFRVRHRETFLLTSLGTLLPRIPQISCLELSSHGPLARVSGTSRLPFLRTIDIPNGDCQEFTSDWSWCVTGARATSSARYQIVIVCHSTEFVVRSELAASVCLHFPPTISHAAFDV